MSYTAAQALALACMALAALVAYAMFPASDLARDLIAAVQSAAAMAVHGPSGRHVRHARPRTRAVPPSVPPPPSDAAQALSEGAPGAREIVATLITNYARIEIAKSGPDHMMVTVQCRILGDALPVVIRDAAWDALLDQALTYREHAYEISGS